MGIQNLTSFVNSHFTGWRLTELKGRLVVDGHSLKHILNKQDWSHGGQFYQYGGAVRGFYRSLQRSGITPVVILDGIDRADKLKTIVKRKKQRIKFIHDSMTKRKRSREISGNSVCPSLAVEVYIQVLTDLNIEFAVVDGEADDVVVELASFYKCPVLSNDSDFFLCRIAGGYIPVERLYNNNNPIIAELYKYEDFCAQFQFQGESSRLIIPALVGNDKISPVLHGRTDYSSFIRQQIDSEKLVDHRLSLVVCYAASFDSLERFKSQIDSLDCLNDDLKIKLKENCEKSRKIYNSDKIVKQN